MNPPPETSSEDPKAGFGGRFAAGDPANKDRQNRATPDPVQATLASLQEAFEYFSFVMSARVDALKASTAHLFVYAALTILGIAAAVAFVATAGVLICLGIAGGLTPLLGNMPWLAQLVTGVVILGAAAAVVAIFVRSFLKLSRQKLVQKYENRIRHQQAEFGHTVHDRAVGD